ncbi:MAG TPA: DUF6491 family protein [Steroidobacteraceae bacterium]
MNIRRLCISIGVAALTTTAGVGLAAAANAPAAAPTTDVSVPFANHGGIRDWSADNDRGLWVQDAHRKWYYAKLMGPCMGLNFATSIGFDTRPMGTLDRFSTIIVPREGRCTIESLAPSEGPPVKHKAAAGAPASAATGSAATES